MTAPQAFGLCDAEPGVAPIQVYLAPPGSEQTAAPVHTQNWASAHGYTGATSQTLIAPDGEGRIAEVVRGIRGFDSQDIYAIGDLPEKLPPGRYGLATRVTGGSITPAQWQNLALGWALGSYRFEDFKTNKTGPARTLLQIGPDWDRADLLREAEAIYMVRNLINRPANDLATEELGEAGLSLASRFNAKSSIIVGDDLLEQNYPMIHAVGRASVNTPRLVDFTWGNEDHPRVTLVGKGVIFDTGGLDIKPADAMFPMKKDMGGAANVMGLAHMIMDAQLPVRLRVMIPIAENSIGPNAFRPSDVLRSRNGTVENYNTDAEGRLILADALFEAATEKPDLLIDMATLTGAQRIAHGFAIAGVLGTNKQTVRRLEDIGEEIDDPVAGLPLYLPYVRDIKSTIADIQSGGGKAGAITAAIFMHHFTKGAKEWLHFDISAGNDPATPGRPKGGEAMGIRALYRHIEERFVPGR